MEPKPGPKPKRLYLRIVRLAEGSTDRPPHRLIAAWTLDLERVGRLVAHGELVDPPGDLLLFRATDASEAERALRSDPWRAVEGAESELLSWHASSTAIGVNLDPPPSRGTGRLTSLRRVAIAVRDQARSVAWYQEVLGLSVRERETETGFIELALGRGSSGLAVVEPRPEWGEPHYSRTAARVGRETGIVFQTDSVSALALRLQHAGAKVTQLPRAEPWGGSTIRFADPDGNEFLAFQWGAPPPSAPGARAHVPHPKQAR
ncbi:MAG: VOC family protein [Thermoplasmata archaeon]|nr:VOC family protein [Thermoplasmata archaeon]MCI4341329.1 VOC family protein [Thermoplasmata archaeon]